MSFLRLDNDKVICTDDGMTLFEIQRVFTQDKTGPEKEFFKAVITAIYFLFTPRGIYWEKPMVQRIEIVDKDHIKGHKWKKLLESKGVKELSDKYVELTQTASDELEEGLKNDIRELLRIMKDIPFIIDHTIRADSEVKDYEGNLVKVKVSKTIQIPNVEAKKVMIDMGVALSKVMKEVKTNLKDEAVEREKDELETRLYDTRNPTQ